MGRSQRHVIHWNLQQNTKHSIIYVNTPTKWYIFLCTYDIWSCKCIQENLDKFIEITSWWGTRLGIGELKGIFVFLCLEFSSTMKIECIHVLLVKVKMNLKRMEGKNIALSLLARIINRVGWQIVCVMNGISQGTKQETLHPLPRVLDLWSWLLGTQVPCLSLS